MNHTLGLLGPGPRVRVAWTRVCVPRDGFRFYSKVTPKTTTVAIFTHARGPALKLLDACQNQSGQTLNAL